MFGSMTEIKEFLTAFNTVTDANIGIHDLAQNVALESGCRKCNICRYCRKKSVSFVRACQADDDKYYMQAMNTKEITVYRCHLGIYSVIIPIFSEDSFLGVIDFGMIRLPSDPETEFARIFSYLTSAFPEDFLPSEKNELENAFRNTAVMTMEMMDSYAKIVRFSVSGLYADRLLFNGGKSKNLNFHSFIASFDPVSVPLAWFSVERIAKQLNMSYPHLARLSQAELGMSLKQYVLTKKLEAAEKQLGKRSLKEISASVGIDDPQYLSRLFRRHLGISCSDYISLHQLNK